MLPKSCEILLGPGLGCGMNMRGSGAMMTMRFEPLILGVSLHPTKAQVVPTGEPYIFLQNEDKTKLLC